MRRKLQKFKNQIRRQQIDTYFKQKRQQMIRQDTGSNTFFLQTPPRGRQNYQNMSPIEGQNIRQNSSDIYQSWRQNQNHLERIIELCQFQQSVHVLSEIYSCLKTVCNKNSALNWQKQQILCNFLRMNVPGLIIRLVLSAKKQAIAQGLFQAIIFKSISIYHIVIMNDNQSFTQKVFLQGNFLLFLRFCADQSTMSKRYFCKVIDIVSYMLAVSESGVNSGLFDKLNDIAHPFNITFAFYTLSRFNPKPEDQLCIMFLEMIRNYLKQIEMSQYNYKQGKVNQKKYMCLDINQQDLCFKVVHQSIQYFLRNFNKDDQDTNKYLMQIIQVLRLLVEHSTNYKEWLYNINYQLLIRALRQKQIYNSTKGQILSFFDHIIYSDDDNNITIQLVGKCELIEALWPLIKDHHGYVMNILCNLCLFQQGKYRLNSYVHLIFLSFQYQKQSMFNYEFVYNWFSSQKFEILQSRDKLIIQKMKRNQSQDPKIIQLECLFWYNLIQVNNIEVPYRILNSQNKIAHKIVDFLKNHQEQATL